MRVLLSKRELIPLQVISASNDHNRVSEVNVREIKHTRHWYTLTSFFFIFLAKNILYIYNTITHYRHKFILTVVGKRKQLHISFYNCAKV